MPRTKKINPRVQYDDTDWIVNDCGNGQDEDCEDNEEDE